MRALAVYYGLSPAASQGGPVPNENEDNSYFFVWIGYVHLRGRLFVVRYSMSGAEISPNVAWSRPPRYIERAGGAD